MLDWPYRKTLAELREQYRREPSLREIYVEGTVDRSILLWYLRSCGHENVSVFSIDVVEVPCNFLVELGLSDGNRSRVIALSMYLLTIKIDPNRVFCIADKDFEACDKLAITNSALLYTDFTCMEMFLFSEPVFVKFFELYFMRTRANAITWLENLPIFLTKIYSFRLVIHQKNYATMLPDYNKCCRWSVGGVAFDEAEYVTRLHNKISSKVSKTRFIEEIQEAAAKLKGDPRNAMNGHDLITALRSVAIKVIKNSDLGNEVVLGRTINLVLDIEYCRSFEMFNEIDRRVTAQVESA